ncbi:glucokinase regulatory protein isoform X2 [Nycticebus coucang]|uniref:glucokinase regulatory protein isoform X2 n=1 Tax=Nycticebus coucang TaxID=9470 RepID=UPI00234CE297|nr:glucokinase regulatory protein isoform X2 [Nycticebus coucang]
MPGTKRFQHVIETPEPGKWELSGYEAAVPITEKSNPLTQDLDKANAEKIVQLLGQCDAEIFQEEGQAMPTYQRLYSESILTTMVQVAGKVQEVLKEPDGGLVVLSGGGTSGRMAFLMSVSFNQLMKGLGQKPLYTYLIAGGDRSVVASREGTEDSALHGIKELKKVAAGKKKVIVIGISVGLSAPFVAGQMDYCMNNTAVFLPVLVGFNPVSMARNDPIEDWSSTFRQVAERMQKMQENQKAFVLNPAVGPEGLSGSSRMKGGSATKVLLETLLLAAHKTVDRGIAASQSTQSLLAQCCLDTPSLLLLPCLLPTEALTAQPDTVWFLSAPPPGSAELSFEGIMPPLPQIGVGWGEECTGFLRAHKAFLGADGFSPRCLLEILRTFERAHQVTYSQSLKIATLMKQVSTSLEKKGRTYLVGWQTLGIIAIMDGVECIHTFGADFQDIRGFLIGDHSDMFNQKAELTNQGPQFSFSQEDFLTSILPTLTEIDTVVFIFTLDDNLREVQTLVEQVKEKTTNIQALAHSTVGQSLPKFQRELSTKWVLNTVSTGAHVLLGKILQNHMLDLRISNSKLFWRALAMLQRFSGQSKAQCIESLLQAIHFPQPLSDDIRAAPISCHVQVAHEKDQVIPVALLSLLFRCSISEAQAHLAAAPSVCEAVRSALAGPGQKRSADPQRS